MRKLDFAVFDADNHLYEAEDALTRHLPAEHANLFRFVEIKGRKKLVVRNTITEFIPNPTFEVVARPGAHMAFYAADNPEGKSLRELTGEPMACVPAFRSPGPRLELLDEQGVYASHRLSDPGQPHRGTAPGRSRADAGGDPRVQRVAARRVDLRLPGSPVRHAHREPVPARRRHRRARAARRARRQGRAAAPGAGQRPSRTAIAVPARVRPVLGSGRGGRRPGRAARLRQRLPGLPQHLGGNRRRVRRLPAPDRSRRVADGGRVDPGHAGLGHLPRHAQPLPGSEADQRRERRAAGWACW